MSTFMHTFSRRRRRYLTASVATVTGLVLASCAGTASQGSSVEASQKGCNGDKLTLTQSTAGFLYFPSYVAERAGFYEEQGLQVDIKDLGGGSENVAAVVSGSADVALTAYPSILSAREKGAPVVAIGSIMDQYASNVVISKKAAEEAGITEDSPDKKKIAALKGLKLGITSPGSGTDQLFHYLFEQNGMDAGADAQLLPIGGGAPMISAFETGKIDGFALSSPTSDLAVQKGGVMLFDLSSGEYEPLNPFLYIVAVANSRSLKDKSRVLTCFTKAIGQAQQLIHSNPERAKKVGRPAFQNIDQSLYEQAFERNVGGYPESPVIHKESAEKVVGFVESFKDSKLKKATVDNTVNYNFAESTK